MKKHTKTIIAVLVMLVSVGFFSTVLVRATLYDASYESVPDNYVPIIHTSPTKGSVYPDSLQIPALHINAKVQNVGITKKGNMATPNNFTDVGWYKYGTIPGDKGSAVIAGHVDNGLAWPGVFKHLEDIHIGDDVYVKTDGGDSIHFRVIDKSILDFTADATQIFTEDNGSILRLITCTGVWVSDYHTHDKRLVVTAIRADS